MKKINLIAEVGVNHNGKLSYAKKYIDFANKAKIDFIKFQVYKTENLVIKNTKSAPYQKLNTGTKNQFDLLKKYELSFNQHKKIFDYCKHKHTKYMASPFDIESAAFLINKLKQKIIKIPSGEITNFELLNFLANFKIEILLSTGASSLVEIKNAINQLLSKKKISRKNITILQCTTNYPSKYENTNLNVLKTFKSKFKTNIGISDHTESFLVPIISLNFDIKYIEKHITLDKKLKGPDHKSSLNLGEFKQLNQFVKKYKKVYGSSLKKVSQEELRNRDYVRKSYYAVKNIKKGEILNINNIRFLRPFNKIQKRKKIYGSISKKNYRKFELI